MSGAGDRGPEAGAARAESPGAALSVDVAGLLAQLARSFALLLPVYALGYLGLSFSWVLLALGLLVWCRRSRGLKATRLCRALALLEDEERAVRLGVRACDLPAWVHFPDTERAEWLNKTVKHMWPFICQFIEKLFRETIEPAVRGANTHLSTFSFTKVDVGQQPLRINGVKVYTENVDKRQIILDLQISFVGNCEIDLEIKRYFCRAGVQSIQIHGTMRVILEPLIGDMPLVGALSIFFLRKPLIEINWTGLTNLLDIPGLNGLSDTIILDIISNYLVLPNRITVPLVSEVQIAQLRFPIPKGVLRIHFIEAQDLQGKDTYLKGLVKGKSDPYGIIRVGNQIFQSKVIKENLSPKWNEVYEALVYEHPGQELEIELFDEDPDKDDFLGSLMIDLIEVEKERLLDEWFTLDEVPRGKLHLKLEWLTLMPNASNLDKVLTDIRADKDQANDGLSSSLLILYLDSARNLPSGKKINSNPNPLVQMSVGHKAQESKIRYKTNEPVWEENFTFFIHNPKRQDLEVEVKDEQHQCSLGHLKIPLSQLLTSNDMTMNQRFQLSNSGPNSTLKMKIALRILHLEKPERSPDHQHSAQVKRPSVSKEGREISVRSHASASPGSGDGSTAPCTPVVGGSDKPGVEEGAQPVEASPQGPRDLGRSSSSLQTSATCSPSHISVKEPTPSIASDISLPIATQELRQRLRQLENGTTLGQSPLGQIQLTIRHSSQRNKLVVVVHSCRNLIAFSEDGSDPYVRMYLLPDKRRSGRRKTHVSKKTLNPVFDQSFDFSVSLPEVQRRTLDVAVKNSGGFLSKDKGLLGKVLVGLASEELAKGWTQWYDLTEDGTRPHVVT
ncbi:extended synaptotagmin-2 isoform X2 [Prionailurus viverrinus]|uniref:Extended synaptotagmin 2 n=1 Tax=Felis catus TaxID=9685 RepID=A0ABI7VQB3_FELCA|nr:extended synaptotagmin-2 isoform X3 [Felis catus]XP_043445995.1 extended synaptotagmin-2 isoform X4 [Prionailurus bengalensis]XP_046952944.1 extended synaptotagmin-2 isoform X2 [Lynx rufus]XP_047686804.1 extended synaptotagmin-2 isoform X2 [Prionailurus viverrinus]XP_049498169.1 extended synaptotagmin-2 isoform X2 [Panthera uncia]XP_060489513.1 extended synaptotagmin-2 isoform X5 [Panthera onca]